MENSDIFTVNAAGGYEAADVDVYVQTMREGCASLVECAEKMKQQLSALREECQKLKRDNSALRSENNDLYESCVLLAGKLSELGLGVPAEKREREAVRRFMDDSGADALLNEIGECVDRIKSIFDVV